MESQGARKNLPLTAFLDPALIARFRPAMFGCFWPVFFFADHRPSGNLEVHYINVG